MRNRLLLACALAACPLVPDTASARQPASFAKWYTAWTAKTDKTADTVANACLKTFGENDAKVGPCFVKGMRPALRALAPQWERSVAAVAVGQKAACKAAIHAYVVTSRKMQAANLSYLDGHPRTAMTRVLAELKAPPYSAFRTANTNAKAHAVKVCG